MEDNYKIHFNGRNYKYNPFFDFLSNDELISLGIDKDSIDPNRQQGIPSNVVPDNVGHKIYTETIDRYNAIPKVEADVNKLIPGKAYFIEYLGNQMRDGDFWGLQIQEEIFVKEYIVPSDGRRYGLFTREVEGSPIKGSIIFPPTNGSLGYGGQRVPLYLNEKVIIKEALDTTAKDAALSQLKDAIEEMKLNPEPSKISFVGEEFRKAKERFENRNGFKSDLSNKGGKTNKKTRKIKKTRKNKKNKKNRSNSIHREPRIIM